jgi:hypothetical protein
MTREQLENLDRIYTRKLDVLTRIKDIDFLLDLMKKYRQGTLSVSYKNCEDEYDYFDDDNYTTDKVFTFTVNEFEDATNREEIFFDILFNAVKSIKDEYEKIFEKLEIDK